MDVKHLAALCAKHYLILYVRTALGHGAARCLRHTHTLTHIHTHARTHAHTLPQQLRYVNQTLTAEASNVKEWLEWK